VGLTKRGMVLVLVIHPGLVGLGSAVIVDARSGTGCVGRQYLGVLWSGATLGSGTVKG
jgi:hypothetical protein